MGCTRPCRGSSARCHIRRTGLPIALDARAASTAWSGNSLCPKDPPPVITLTVTFSLGSPTAVAMSICATIGTLRPAQTVARSARTSAIAE